MKTGDFVTLKIKGKKYQGVIRKRGNYYSFFQDKIGPPNFNGSILYSKIYGFNSYDLEKGKITLLEIVKGNTQIQKKEKLFIKKINNSHISSHDYFLTKVNTKYIKEYGVQSFVSVNNKPIRLFSTKPHPDCCGCMILYGFEEVPKIHSVLITLTEEEINYIKECLKEIGCAKLAHLSHKQRSAINFVERLGFSLQFSYKNVNSGNMIKVYHRL